MGKHAWCLFLFLAVPLSHPQASEDYSLPPADPRLRLSITLDRQEYTAGDTVRADVQLKNVATSDVRLLLECRRELVATCTVMVVVNVEKVGKGTRPAFYHIAFLPDQRYYTLAAGKWVESKGIEITGQFDGEGLYRIWATYLGSNRSETQEVGIRPKGSQQTGARDGGPAARGP